MRQIGAPPVHATTVIAVLLVAVVGLVWAAQPASAIGAQGVDLRALLERGGSQNFPTTPVSADTVVQLRLTNTTSEPRLVSVTPQALLQPEGGGASLGAPLDWIDVDLSGPGELEPGETRELSATIDLAGYREAELDVVAFVLSVDGGGNVITQAAEVVALRDAGGELPTPVALLIIALALVAIVSAAWFRFAPDAGLVVPWRRATGLATTEPDHDAAQPGTGTSVVDAQVSTAPAAAPVGGGGPTGGVPPPPPPRSGWAPPRR